MDFLVLQHLDIEPPALIGEELEAAGHRLHTLRMDLNEALPEDTSGFAGIILMGGPQSANDTHLLYIRNELPWLAGQIAKGKPMLGICLGSQLMAKAAGGSISPSPVRELGWFPVYPTDAAIEDPVFSLLPADGQVMFQWHGETFHLPPQATLLATHPEVAGQAFRLDRAQYGLQFHVEVDEQLIGLWIEAGESERAHLGDDGLAALHGATTEHLAPMREFCRRMVRAWLELIDNP